MKIKLLAALVAISMLPISASTVNAADTKADPKAKKGDAPTSKVTKDANADAKAVATAAAAKSTTGTAAIPLLANQSTKPPATTLVQPFMPTNRVGSWNFGVWRNRATSNYYHKGLDFSGHGGTDDVKFTSSGFIAKKAYDFNELTFQRPNGDQVAMLHASRVTSTPMGKGVTAGDYALTMGKRGKNGGNPYAKHLHYEYHVPRASGRQRFVGLGGTIAFTTKGKGVTYHPDAMGSVSGFSGKGLVVTDPTPYLKNDVVFNGTLIDSGLKQYIGGSARTQYNALYKPVPPLAVAAGVPRATKTFPNLPSMDNMSPEDIAAMSGGAVDAALYGESAGYGIDGQLLSQRMIATFISDSNGNDWNSLPKPPSANLAEMTPQEIADSIAFKRFGNQEWEAAMIKLSTKGLLTEYLMLTAEENFMRQQVQRLKDRVELQMASLTSANLFEYNKHIEAMNIAVTAESVPSIIDEELEMLSSGYYSTGGSSSQMDTGPLPADLNGLLDRLMQTITKGEAHNARAYNTGQGCSFKGVNKNIDITTMTPVQILRRYTPSYSPPTWLSVNGKSSVDCSQRIFASGYYQTIPATLSGILRKHPEYANLPYTEANQKEMVFKGLLWSSHRDKLSNFLRHGGGEEQFNGALWELSREWASLAVPVGMPREEGKATQPGQTYYTKKGGNHADAAVTAEINTIMRAIQAFHNGSSPTKP